MKRPSPRRLPSWRRRWCGASSSPPTTPCPSTSSVRAFKGRWKRARRRPRRWSSPELIKSGFAAVYAQLKPGASVPAALVESDRRSLALRAAAPAAPAAPTAEGSLSPAADLTSGERAALEGVHPESAADNAWFIQTFCNVASPYSSDQCEAGWGWADVVSGAAEDAWQSFADVGGEGTVSAPYYGDFWSCWNSGFLGLGTTCGYNRGFTDSVPPGHWHSWTGSYASGFNPRDFHFNISGANATVGLISKFNVFHARPVIIPAQ